MSDIKVTNLRKNFGAVEVLKDINLDIRSGEFVIFVGPSGCGKSTLLRCISGLERISGGALEIGGRVVNNVPASKRGIAMVFQSYALYPHMSVRENMAYSMKLRRAPKTEIEVRVADAARKLQLAPYLDRYPRELSGGQRQRVAIGRAIVRDPQVFLFDEPLSNLDAALRVATRLEIARLKESLPQTTMVYVTHDQVEAMTLADRIVVLNAGRVEQVGTPEELYERPQSLFVAGFIGSPKMNLLKAEDGTTTGIRPEDINLGSGPHRGKVAYVEYLGADSYAFLDIGQDELLTVRQTRSETPQVGDVVSYDYPVERVHRFDAQGMRVN
ncbi:ABC transporter ATP-binding protein [Devosia elaeis]|uniref:Sugar ABC transporter ATP-binding protein n=1 Tax=Devosia elaeis TaxID=1770058 RepID=A0A178HYL7_9HYPH|nr:ABC transporter ATP-binding protein [Devosia elaeis]OAM77911.1 sugar ABC transporter ATP-binding protein [Devosia elaeis]